MGLGLRYRVHEGIKVTEDLKRGGRKIVDVVVRGISKGDPNDLEGEVSKTEVVFELIDGNVSEILTLIEGEEYNVTPRCTLHLPISPIKTIPINYMGPIHLMKSREKRVFLRFSAPRKVNFGDKKIYPPHN